MFNKRNFVFLTFSVLLAGLIFWLSRPEPVVETEHVPEKVLKVLGKESENEELPTDRPDQALLYEVLIRSEIGKPFSYKGNWKFLAFQQARRQMLLEKATAWQWTERGPGNIGGRTRAVVVHPKNKNIWWAGAVGGGVWKTEDAGAHWRPVTDDMPVISVCTIAVCDSLPNVLYAGTGEGFGNYDRVIGDGIFKSTDGGESWTQLTATAGNYDFRYVNRLVVHPFHPDTVLAATNAGVFRSLDGGATWEQVLDAGGRVLQLIANPKNFNTLFAAVNAKGIYKSRNLGQTWQYVSEEIQNHKRIEMAIAPSDTNVLYAAAVNDNSGLGGFYQSTDAGESWTNLGTYPNWLGKQGWYDNALAVHPFRSDVVFVGGIDLYQVQVKSGSMTATQISSWWGGNGLPYVHADQHAITPIPRADSTFALIAGNDGGIFYSADGGVNWEARNNQYSVTQYYDAARHPFLEQYIGGTQDNGTSISPVNSNGASNWQHVIGGDGFDCAWDYFDPYNVYGTLYDSRIFKSTDGGNTFQSINNGLPESNIFHTPLEMDPFNPDKLFTISESNKIYITYNGGQSWKGFPVDLNGASLVKISVSRADSSVVWIASTSAYINVSQDGGKTFQKAATPSNSPQGYVLNIATNPMDSASAIVTFGVSGFGKVFRTRDFGQTWEDLTNNLPDVPVHCALYMPYDTTQIWLGTDIGLFISTDNGQTWQFASGSLPAVSIRRLKIYNKEIIAATHGRGVWSLYDDQLPELVVPTRPPVLKEIIPPHPVNQTIKVYFRTRSAYDSAQVLVNDEISNSLGALKAYKDTFALAKVYPPDYLDIQVVGFKDGKRFVSDTKSLFIYEAVDSAKHNFNSGFSDFNGDFYIDKPQNFNSSALQTEHPYQNKRDYIALLGTPVKVTEKFIVSYKDIALVEPGEPGYNYPDYRMWDYVTLEGSVDGENWDILITPYDCRFNSQWKSYYDQGKDPTDALFVKHEVDLSDFYQPGQIVYLRFRLFADDYSTGWGWIIDDFKAYPVQTTGIAEQGVPAVFRLYDNFPNPFNPQTTISFTLDRNGPVSLVIFNSVGQKVRTLVNNRHLLKGNRYRFVWRGRNDSGDPVASGVYFYRLKTPKQTAVKKMLLMR